MADSLQEHHVEHEVLRRYKEGAASVQPNLCCPVEYDDSLLNLLPQEIVDKDYGCGDPSKYVQAGETALDLGSGTGKICYMLSQKVGPEGAVIGIDFNDDMLTLARKYQDEMAEKIGYANVEFRKGRIQDLSLSLDALQAWLNQQPVDTIDRVMALEAETGRLRSEQPLVGDQSVDVIVSNCVLNLVKTTEKAPLFKEMFRVLRPGGRAVISDIVCDKDPTKKILNDPELWSGCISGAFREDDFLQRFEDAGFRGVQILERQAEPWQVIDGVEFRSMTVSAHRMNKVCCSAAKDHQVVYKGPWKAVADDKNVTYRRGLPTEVSKAAFDNLTGPGPYQGEFIGFDPEGETTGAPPAGGGCCG